MGAGSAHQSESDALGSLAMRHLVRGAHADIGALRELPLEWGAGDSSSRAGKVIFPILEDAVSAGQFGFNSHPLLFCLAGLWRR